MDGSVALVTGGASGIGRATTLALAGRGAFVVVADIAEEGGRETAALAGERARFIRADASSADDVERVFTACVREHGGLDIVHNNAGIAGSGKLVHETGEDEWDRVFGINARGAWLVLRRSLAAMRERGGGAIVNTVSVGAHSALHGSGAYCASKAALLMLTRVAAIENADHGIRVNAVAPGLVTTPMTDKYRDADALPVARMAEPEEIAEGVAWLCSDAASYVNGICLTIDGGWTTAAPPRPRT